MHFRLIGILFAIGIQSAAWSADGPVRSEEIIVETSRAGLSVLDMPVNTTVLDQQDLRTSTAQTVDQVLREVPGFSLLRAGDSIATSPTASTVSLRGLGGSAASRTLIMLDGVPIHNPYSSEVYWARIPKHQIERIEIVRGGGANAWGNLSLGGVINILTSPAREDGVYASGSISSPQTLDLHLSGSQVIDNWSFSGGASWYDTDGYKNLPDSQQGPIDEEVRKEYFIVSGKAAYQFSDKASIYFNGSYFDEERVNATPLDVNEGDVFSLGTGLVLDTADGSRWSANLFYDDTGLDDVSTRVNGARDSETIRSARTQPTSVFGTNLVWSRRFAESHTLTAGVDYRWTDMDIDEFLSFSMSVPGSLRVTSGDQELGGLFVQDVWEIDERWQINASVRYDYVTNEGAVTVTDLTTNTLDSTEAYASNSESTLNPGLGVRYRAANWLSLRAAAYAGYRAATMRELYRTASTRGGVILVNSPNLEPERLIGIEAGADFSIDDVLDIRVTLFQNTVEDLIQNITRGVASAAPEVVEPCGLIDAGEICRELDNIGEMEAQGLELTAEYRPAEDWSFFLSYLYNDTEVTEAPDNPQIMGNEIRQAPEDSFTAKIRNSNRWFDTTLQGRYVGDRFEDDLNTLKVDSFFLVDAMISRKLSESTEVFFSIENAFDKEYEVTVDSDGVSEIGRPRFVSLGFRYRHQPGGRHGVRARD